MFYNVVEFEKQIEREECCGVATKNQIECTIIENREVAGERLRIIETEFPPELYSFKSIIAGGVKYINKNFTFSAFQEKL